LLTITTRDDLWIFLVQECTLTLGVEAHLNISNS
jgi:hypothetical protein